MSEATEQEALFRWAEYAKGKHPELRYMFHIPNGGSRNKAEAANLRRQGVRPGVPDIFLPVARGGFHGLFIEMKYGKNTLSEKQSDYIEFLLSEGYQCRICYGWEQAKNEIEHYLSGGGNSDRR